MVSLFVAKNPQKVAEIAAPYSLIEAVHFCQVETVTDEGCHSQEKEKCSIFFVSYRFHCYELIIIEHYL